MKTPLLIAAALIAFSAAAQADRFPTPEQTKLVQALLAGPRGGGDASPEAAGAASTSGSTPRCRCASTSSRS
jgi:hypothetical protein